MIPLGLYSHLAAAGVAASMAASGAWYVQELRMDSREKDNLELQSIQTADLRRLEQARIRNVIDAINVSRASEEKLRAESAANRNALVGLRSSSSKALSHARTSLDACIDTTVTYDELFTASTERYTELAEKADRHLIDIKALTKIGN